MNIPETVKIGGIIYKVTKTNLPRESDKMTDGCINYSSGEIRISNAFNECKDYMDYVLIHEVMHGILDHVSIEQDEAMVDKISKGLHMVIKDNPDMFSASREDKAV